ncbi:hypothetical protein B0H10DRAFT_1959027 [Mycena sp. CBHHK59/15]|nr:hypothetical protein B0H10DRAFT_1959027 [Mycena sp. CBHHK59/15]
MPWEGAAENHAVVVTARRYARGGKRKSRDEARKKRTIDQVEDPTHSLGFWPKWSEFWRITLLIAPQLEYHKRDHQLSHRPRRTQAVVKSSRKDVGGDAPAISSDIRAQMP